MKRKNDEHQTTVEREAFGHDLEVEITVVFELEPGEKPIRYGDNACEGCDASVEILAAYVTKTGEPITLTDSEENGIKDDIIEGAERNAASGRYDAMERKGEAARDERMFGRDE